MLHLVLTAPLLCPLGPSLSDVDATQEVVPATGQTDDAVATPASAEPLAFERGAERAATQFAVSVEERSRGLALVLVMLQSDLADRERCYLHHALGVVVEETLERGERLRVGQPAERPSRKSFCRRTTP